MYSIVGVIASTEGKAGNIVGPVLVRQIGRFDCIVSIRSEGRETIFSRRLWSPMHYQPLMRKSALFGSRTYALCVGQFYEGDILRTPFFGPRGKQPGPLDES